MAKCSRHGEQRLETLQAGKDIFTFANLCIRYVQNLRTASRLASFEHVEEGPLKVCVAQS
jgi:hypothetical protein